MIMTTKKITGAYQVLKEYKNSKCKTSITALAKKHDVNNLGIVAKRSGLLKELETRRPTTQDAINSLEQLFEYTNGYSKKTKVVSKGIVKSKVEKNAPIKKIKKAIETYESKQKSFSFLWGAVKIEW